MMDAVWMRRALALAERAMGTTAPNPPVGAVIVRGDQLLGEGFTRPVGGAHAEVEALAAARAAGHDPRGATMIVTLEPCCHYGRTPPCTDALLAAGIARVVVGIEDPFPLVAGKGLQQLREAGVAVIVGVEADACARAVLGFTRSVRHGLPEVSCKIAVSADGHIATATGESRWITGEAARAHAHGLRATHDAIAVGIRTAISDDPQLTCRTETGRDPVPVVFDSHLRLPASAVLLRSSKRAVILCAEDAPPRDLPADIVRLPRQADGGLDVESALKALSSRGLHRVLIDGGGRLHRSLLDARLVDTLHLYVADRLLPGGVPAIGGPPVDKLAEGPRLGRPSVRSLGEDVLLTYTLAHRHGVA